MMTGLQRRTALGVLLGGVVAHAANGSAAYAQSKSKKSNKLQSDQGMTGKIDTHQHFLPKIYVDAVGLDELGRVMPSGVAPAWSPELALAMMDENGIAEGILSVSSGPFIPDAANLLRKCNEYAAKLRSQHKGRFGSFASLPLPDIDASLKEIAFSLDDLKADGFIVFTNYDGKYLGEPSFAPVFDELNRRKAIVFIHPNKTPYDLQGLPPQSVLEFPFDTTRTAASLIMSGAMKRWPEIKFILSHAGGALPYLSQRLVGGILMTPGADERVGDPMAAIAAFYFDTALSFSKPAMAALMAVADPSHILFGTDFPMAPAFAIKSSLGGLQQMPVDEKIRDGIARGNAARLLGRTLKG